MAYIMDMASGTVHPVEEPSYKTERASQTESRDVAGPVEYPQLQLAMIELQTPARTQDLPPLSVDALLKTLED